MQHNQVVCNVAFLSFVRLIHSICSNSTIHMKLNTQNEMNRCAVVPVAFTEINCDTFFRSFFFDYFVRLLLLLLSVPIHCNDSNSCACTFFAYFVNCIWMQLLSVVYAVLTRWICAITATLCIQVHICFLYL